MTRNNEVTLGNICKVGITLIFQNRYSVDKSIFLFDLLGEGAFKDKGRAGLCIAISFAM